MTIKVCVGSSCHLKGSYDVIEKLKEVIDRYGVADKVELMASFCLGNCQNGVSATCDGELLSNLRPENVCATYFPSWKNNAEVKNYGTVSRI